MSDQDSFVSKDKYIEHRPKVFNSEIILVYLNALDKNKLKAEEEYEECKDQVQEQLDFIISEKVENTKCSMAQAKVLATNDERYKNIKAEYRKRKAYYLLKKVEANNGHSYCENLKQESINQLAVDKLTRN